MEVRYKNLTIRHKPLEYADLQGDSDIYVPTEIINEVVDHYGGEVLYYNFEYDGEEWLSELKKTGHICDPDAFVRFLGYMLGEEERTFNIEYEGKLFWLFHDIAHAEEHLVGVTIYVSAYIENQAHQMALEMIQERNLELDLSLQDIESLSGDFYSRFREGMTPALKDYLLAQYEEESN